MPARKHQLIKNIDKTISGVSSTDMAKIVIGFLKSPKFDLDARRSLMVEFKKVSVVGDVDLQIYPDMFISEYQYGVIRHSWAQYIQAVIEVAHDTTCELDNIIDVLDVFLQQIGETHLIGMGANNRSKGVISAILLLGGYHFKTQRTDRGSSRRILMAIPGTELMNLEDRQQLAFERCQRLNIK